MNSKPQLNESQEESLIQHARGGDLEAFNELVLAYQDMAYSHATAVLGDADLAEDAAQESFIKAFQALNQFRGGSFRGWLLKIVTNSAYDLVRRHRRHPARPLFPEDGYGEEVESPAWIADPAPSVQATVEKNELSQDIYRMMDELPDVYRSVLTLIDLYELDYSDAARALKVPIGTIKSRLARARLQMQVKLKNRISFPLPFAGTDARCAA
ncbi:MAG TPA: RNA polymerase sigma factor [Anaerolineales bacterium]|nr:RNA polymerase sigma factor [Anaerolineales bacterium]